MSKTPMKTEGYESRRYFIPTSLLASQTPKSTAKVRKRIMKPEPLTYSKLISGQQQAVSIGQLNSNTFANRTTALRHFLRANHLQEADVVGLEMRPHFPMAVDRLLDKLRCEQRLDRHITNTKAALTPWKQLVVQHDIEMAYLSAVPTPYLTLVKEITQGQNINKVSRQAGVPLTMLEGWLRGKNPRKSNVKYVRRLEVFFGLERNVLVGLTGFSMEAEERAQTAPVTPVSFRERQRDRSKDSYYLQVQVDSPFRAQWLAFMKYKTTPVPILRRSGRGKWTFAGMTAKLPITTNWFTFLDGVEVPTAYAVASKIFSYLGWLSLAPSVGGMGLPVESMHTMAWLAVPDFVERYLDWTKERAGGKRTSGTSQFLAVVANLVRPKEGYLTQQPQFLLTLPNSYHQLDWDNLCAKQFEYVGKLQAAYSSEIVASRDSFEPIRHLIDLPQPMEAVADMVQRMRADRPATSLSAEAIWARDIFLVKLFVSNPLRLRNIACLEWNAGNIDGKHPDGKCSLYQKVDGSWWIYVPKRLMKNRGGKQIRDYDSPIHISVWRDLERYLLKHRPTLLKWSSNLVFLASGRDPTRVESTKKTIYKKKAQTGHRPFLELSGRLFELTRRYLWKCDGIHAHAFRHIVATSILKTPGGDIKTAALVLHDAEVTVAKHYSGMRSSDGSVRMAELLGSTFGRM